MTEGRVLQVGTKQGSGFPAMYSTLLGYGGCIDKYESNSLYTISLNFDPHIVGIQQATRRQETNDCPRWYK